MNGLQRRDAPVRSEHAPAPASPYRPLAVPDSLERWLARGRRWDIEYGGFLSNHITHNWVVLGIAGASEATMQWWEDLYLYRLPDIPRRVLGALEPPRALPADLEPLTEDSWLRHVRRTPVNFAAYQRFFDERVARLGGTAAVRRYLPPLLPGFAGRALHPVIHTGWGVEASSPSMIADGLAYMACAYQPLLHDPLRDPGAGPIWEAGDSDLLLRTARYLGRAEREGFSALVHRTSQTDAYIRLQSGAFQHRVAVFDDPALPPGPALGAGGPIRLPEDDEALVGAIEEACALIAAAVVAARSEFFVVHGLTSLHAAVVLGAHLGPVARRDALAYWWRAAMAALVSQGLPGHEETLAVVADWKAKRDQRPAPHTPSPSEDAWWTASLHRSLDSLDEHVPKGVFALGRWARWGRFSAATHALLCDAARQLLRPTRPGNVADNLWLSRDFSINRIEEE